MQLQCLWLGPASPTHTDRGKTLSPISGNPAEVVVSLSGNQPKAFFSPAVVVVVAFSSFARILGDCSTIHSLPALLSVSFLLLFLKEDIRSRTLISLFTPESLHSGCSGGKSNGVVGQSEPSPHPSGHIIVQSVFRQVPLQKKEVRIRDQGKVQKYESG